DHQSGAGYVTYLVQPKAGLPTGTPIGAAARVQLDDQPPLDTNVLAQELDAQAPTTSLAPPTPITAGGSDYLLQWTVQDDAGGSGVKGVTVYVSDNGGPYAIWLQQTTDTSAVYHGSAGHTDQFLALAADNAGNRERPPEAPPRPD